MTKLEYSVDGSPLVMDSGANMLFETGSDVCLSGEFADITKGFDWYTEGYTLLCSREFMDIEEAKLSLLNQVKGILCALGVKVSEDFTLEKYHQYVDAELHTRVIERTRQLTAADLSFDVKKFVNKISEYFGRSLSWSYNEDYDPKIIARINMPGSIHFNPPHKDIYQVYDSTGTIPTMVNVWIPICGVSERTLTGLPVAPGSHLLSEKLIERTKAGALINGIEYSVNCIASWDGRRELETICPREDQMLVFSSFLIHGAAVNHNADTTRISLEFRLFDK